MARLRATGNAATVRTYRRVGHYFIVAALAPFLRLLVPVLRDVDAFVADIVQSSQRTAPAAKVRRAAVAVIDRAREAASS